MSRPRSLLALASLVAIALSGATPALAGQLVPVPTVVIYPGDIIRDGMLTEREMPDDFAGLSAAVLDRSALINKTSRRTLLPNLPIARTSVGEPKVVTLWRERQNRLFRRRTDDLDLRVGAGGGCGRRT